MQFTNKYFRPYEPYLTHDDDGREILCDIDPYAGQEFNINEHGFIRNDISAALQATSQSEFDARLSRLQVLPDESNNMTDDQLFDSILPRYAQSPKDVVRFTQYLGEKQDKHQDSSEDSVNSKVTDPDVSETKE